MADLPDGRIVMILARPALAVIGAAALLLAAFAPSGATATTSTWTDIKVPLPANADHTFAQLNSVNCPSAKACTAVGSYTGSAGYQGLLVVKSGSTWTATQAPVPTGAAADPFTDITAVSCFSASACAAIGFYTDTSGNSQGLLITGSGSDWTAAEAPLPHGAYPDLSAVRCVSATSCVAVGSYTDPSSGYPVGVLVTGFGTTWTATQAPLPAGANAVQSGLTSVACLGHVECTAVGSYTVNNGGLEYPEGWIVSGYGSSWTAMQAPLPAGGDPQSSLTAIRCLSSSACVATGWYQVGQGVSESDAGLLLSGSGTTWTATQAPQPPKSSTPPYEQLGMLACRPGACDVIGTYDIPAGSYTGLIVSGWASTWTATPSPFPSNAEYSQVVLHDVSCASADACVIAGTYQTASNYDTSMLLLGSGSSWSAIEPPYPGNNAKSAYIPAVACGTKATVCIGVGSYIDRFGNDQALLTTGPP